MLSDNLISQLSRVRQAPAIPLVSFKPRQPAHAHEPGKRLDTSDTYPHRAMAKSRITTQLRVLQQKHDVLQLQVKQLGRTQRALTLRHGLLLAMCDALALLQLSVEQPTATSKACEVCTRAGTSKYTQLQHHEAALLEQLTCSDSSDTQLAGQPLQGLLDGAATSPLASTDPLWYLNSLLSRGIAEDSVSSMSAEDLARMMQRDVHAISIKLHQAENMPPWQRPPKLAEIGEVWDRYMHAVVSFIMMGRQDILETAHTINFETLTPEPSEAIAHQAAQAAALVPLLDLPEEQQEVIAAGMSLFYDLLNGLHKEQQELQLLLAAADDMPASPCSSADTGGGGGGGGAEHGPGGGSPSSSPSPSGSLLSAGSASAGGVLNVLSSRQAVLAEQQQWSARLHGLLQKEYQLKMIVTTWLCGSIFNYNQLSKLAVMSWPYGARVLLLATEVMRHHDALVQQRDKVVSCHTTTRMRRSTAHKA